MKKDIQSQDDIRILVDTFYSRAAADDLLGPIFSGIGEAGHREQLYTYWSNALLHPAVGKVQPFPRHIESMFSPQHFLRWLTLFLETIDAQHAGPVADRAKVIVIRKSEQFQTRLQMIRF